VIDGDYYDMNLDNEKDFKVKLNFKATISYKIKAEDRNLAHKKAYNKFMDTPSSEILKNSTIDDFFIETSIDGWDGSDMLHD
jgi:hypothetical protein